MQSADLIETYTCRKKKNLESGKEEIKCNSIIR